MKFKENANVLTADLQKAGRLEQLVIDPQTKEVTDIVVTTGGFLSKEDKVVPIDMIDSVQGEEILLRPGAGDLNQSPEFEEEHFVSLSLQNQRRMGYQAPAPVVIGYTHNPYAVPGHTFIPTSIKKTEKNIPEETVALEIGAPVYSVDGELVGTIETILTQTSTDRAAHFVIAQGLLLKERKLVPANWVSHIDEDQIHLVVDTQLLDKLPPYEGHSR